MVISWKSKNEDCASNTVDSRKIGKRFSREDVDW